MNSATSFRVCILAYSRIAKTARQVIRELPTNDVEYVVLESGLANEQEASVAEALRLGCDVFIAGPAGAALFSSQYHYPIVSFEVSDLDYLRAIRTAQEQGYRQIGLMRYHHSPSLPLELYSRLLQVKLTELVYEEIPQLYEITKKPIVIFSLAPQPSKMLPMLQAKPLSLFMQEKKQFAPPV